MTKEKISKRKRLIVEKAMYETIDMINEKGRCFLVRPTGFGKTWIANKISKSYNKVIYVYPRRSVMNQFIEQYKPKDNVVFVSYYYLSRLKNVVDEDETKKLLYNMDSSDCLFVFDEAHFMGASEASKCITELYNANPNAHYLGITATPNRLDGFDVETVFFDNCCISNYNINNAIDDKIYTKPIYVYTERDLDKQIAAFEKELNTSHIDREKKKELLEKLNKLKSADIYYDNLGDIIKSNLGEIDGYRKFLAFYTTCEMMDIQMWDLIKAFKEEYPDKEVRYTIIRSDKNEYHDFDRIVELEEDDNIIDLILSIDMLSYGIHTDHVNGEFMFRRTCSDIVYGQQIGRVFDIRSTTQAYIFDIVQNRDICNTSDMDILNMSKYKDDKDNLDRAHVIMKSSQIDFLSIRRLYNQYKTEDVRDEVIRAYLRIPEFDQNIAMKQLKIKDAVEFENMVNEYKHKNHIN